MPNISRQRGISGESIAARYLEQNGYEIIERNWYCRWGEIDIIARSPDGILVFAEVKSCGESGKFGDPLEWITSSKIRKIIKSTRQFLFENEIDDTPVRFDVLTVDLSDGRVEHFKDAFPAD